MNKKLVIFSIVITLLSFFITGCANSNKVEINDLALVMVVGIDKGEENPNNILVTVQVALPANARGSTGSPTGTGLGEPIWTATGEGKSIFEAIRNIGRYSSRRLFWAHNQAIIISEEFARKEGITDIIDFFTRNNQLRMRTWVLVTPKKAKDLVATKTGLEVIPGESLDKLFRYNEIIAEAPKTDMRLLTAAYMSESSHPVLAKVDIKDRGISSEKAGEFGSTPQVELSGTAVFNRAKMIGWLNTKESRGLLCFIEGFDSAVIPLECPSDRTKPVSVELKDNQFKVTPHYENGKVSFDINVTTYGELVELGCSTNYENSVIMAKLEEQLRKELKSNIRDVIKKAQKEYKIDFIKLGETFNNRYPSEWKQLRDQWEEIFPTIDVAINVDAKIKSGSLLENPTRDVKE